MDNPQFFLPTQRDIRRRYAYPLVIQAGSHKWFLIYDRRAKTGTGPFKTKTAAIQWYNNGGR